MAIIPEATCKRCGKVNKQHTAIDGPHSIPCMGDISICSTCGGINMFDENLDLTPAPPALIESLKTEDPIGYIKILIAQAMIKGKQEFKYDE